VKWSSGIMMMMMMIVGHLLSEAFEDDSASLFMMKLNNLKMIKMRRQKEEKVRNIMSDNYSWV
jgi:hypothetical protein